MRMSVLEVKRMTKILNIRKNVTNQNGSEPSRQAKQNIETAIENQSLHSRLTTQTNQFYLQFIQKISIWSHFFVQNRR